MGRDYLGNKGTDWGVWDNIEMDLKYIEKRWVYVKMLRNSVCS
jgi:hypothetical protein